MREVEIREMVLRLPGMSRYDARWIAEEIADRLAETIPAWGEHDAVEIPRIRVKLAHGARRDEIARVVAVEIARALR